ncbi:hypothetical protein PV327_000295 [Microctonus hyperodae]|uniref:Uncharacterized protein n=1 Tax=Microctonus hyperodae TaxID=165561 RepID=A0AA39G5X1_MICHY|nr:hypothetical protein PV327_000295 [Microctonus hyperodae]
MSCFNSQEELLYLLELIVDNLILNADKIHEAGDNLLVVKIKFLSMPLFVISQNDFEIVNAINDIPNGKLAVFDSGISRLFSKCASDLVGEMQKTPLRIGVFCVGDIYPLAEAILPFTGCLCDQIAMALNDDDHMPEPYILHGRFGLLDPGKNPSGSINFKLKITCLGKHVTTYYQMEKNSFVFKNDRDVGQYLVKRVVPPISEKKNEQEKLNNEIPDSGSKSMQIPNENVNDDDEKSKKKSEKKKEKIII